MVMNDSHWPLATSSVEPIAPGWATSCTPPCHTEQDGPARELVCGHGHTAYDMCVNYPERTKACDACSVCECAKQCIDAGDACHVMLFQQETNTPGNTGNQCYFYKSCTTGSYTPAGGSDWCIVIGRVLAGADAAASANTVSWALILTVALMGAVYYAGGVWLGRRQGLKRHVHAGLGRQIGGLVLDGCRFTIGCLARGDLAGRQETLVAAVAEAEADATGGRSVAEPAVRTPGGSAASAVAATAMEAERGQAGSLHHAAALGDAAKLRALLTHRNGKNMMEIDKGDQRCFTPFAAACAGGHAECVTVLLEAGCDPTLVCDIGRTGAELAAELRRTEVVAVLQSSLAAENRGRSKKMGNVNKGRRQARASTAPNADQQKLSASGSAHRERIKL